MLSSRQQLILKAIVEDFIENAEPVGSKTLVEKYGLDYSTATIRNEMNYLEQEGLLEKTHTSSGRVPSALGYRYYVEFLMETGLNEEEKFALQSAFSTTDLSIEDVIQQSCDVLSNMTNLTSVVLGPDANKQRLAHIRLFPLDDHNAVAVIITDQGHTENKTFHFEDQITVEDIQNCTDILNDRLVGTPINEVVEKMNDLRPILAHSVKRHEALFNAFMQAFIKFASDSIYFAGASNMLYQPEFSDVERVKSLMKMLESTTLWRNLGAGENSLTLQPKDEKNAMVWMDNMAVVSRKFMLDGKERQMMILGPSRMNYTRICSIMEYELQLMEDHFKKKK